MRYALLPSTSYTFRTTTSTDEPETYEVGEIANPEVASASYIRPLQKSFEHCAKFKKLTNKGLRSAVGKRKKETKQKKIRQLTH